MESFSSVKFLAGTVAIPSTFPDVAEIVLTKNKEVQITVINPRYTLIRYVSHKDFVAAFDATESTRESIRSDWRNPAKWISKEEIAKLETTRMGIVYVTEHARVLVQAEFGLTAADSADYSPTMMHMACCPCCRPKACCTVCC